MTRPWTSERLVGLFDRLDDHADAAVRLRHDLHAEPRVGGKEEDTTRTLLEALGCPDEQFPSGGALVRIGDGAGPAVGLRAELDALPMQERSGAEWSSRNGAMHACGHDVHMAAAYAVARTLQDSGTPAPLVLTLQPREEVLPSGAEDIALSPEFTEQGIGAFVGVHVQPRLAQRHFAATAGPVNAAADQFAIEMTGEPGHGAYPHLTDDPVVAMADLVGTLQHLVSRQVDPTNPTVLTIGTINGGSSPNVVPASVRITGILRTFDEEERVRLHAAIGESARAVASAHGCEAIVEMSLGAPVLVNDAQLTSAASRWLEKAELTPSPPLRSCGADDFSYYCPLFPSLMVFLGVGSGDPEAPGLHHPEFLPPDETVMDVAHAMLAGYLGGCSTLLDLPALTG